jgi:hypothetical protein
MGVRVMAEIITVQPWEIELGDVVNEGQVVVTHVLHGKKTKDGIPGFGIGCIYVGPENRTLGDPDLTRIELNGPIRVLRK